MRIRIALLLLSLQGIAFAQTDPIAAEAQFREGREALKKGDFTCVATLVEGPEKLEPSPASRMRTSWPSTTSARSVTNPVHVPYGPMDVRPA